MNALCYLLGYQLSLFKIKIVNSFLFSFSYIDACFWDKRCLIKIKDNTPKELHGNVLNQKTHFIDINFVCLNLLNITVDFICVVLNSE